MKKSLITLLILALAAFASTAVRAQDDVPQDGTDLTTPDSPRNGTDQVTPDSSPDDDQPPAGNPDEPQPSSADPIETGITPPMPKSTPSEPKNFIIKAGVENMSRSDYVSGGSYLYAELWRTIFDDIFISAKISSSVVPTEQDTCLFGGLTYNALKYGEYAAYISPFYMTNLTPDPKGRNHHVGGKFCLFAQNNPAESVYVELLPFSFLYDTRTKDISYAFEFITMGVRF